MISTLQPDAPPLRRDSSGAWRVGESRVLLELVIHGFQDGLTPETIVQQYSSLSLADTYTAIGYYLHHREELDRYIADREILAEEIRQRIENRQGDLAELRARLAARRND